jgi:Holliday junction resolvasome RuvABC endonuclease subunit
VDALKVVGLDLSISEPGLTHTVEGAACTHVLKTKGVRDLRLPEIKNWVLEFSHGAELVLIEGYLNRSMSAGITGMVHGAVRLGLIEAGIPYATFPPASNKKYATGKGGASKTEMAIAALKRGGVEFTNDNACDSWWLWVALNDHLGAARFPLPIAQRDALSKITREV